ncbi:ORCT-like protein [Mya arenaria]|uniref:ORCT-like protein n=1 Tax=Mya arenaria TaxID=6604 RepID=A0ABY7E0Y9_MYAAR|nr:organic cation transporter protein-like [Mya arenaria]WAR02642.1 ORCT-like protein [Mya arenaria]
MKVKLEELLSQLGNPGRYQLIVFFLLCLNYFPLVFNHVIMAFFGSRPTFECQSRNFSSSTLGDWYDNVTMGIGSYGNVSGLIIESSDIGRCSSTYHVRGGENVTVTCPVDPNGLVVYQKTEQFSSIVTEWDLICDQSYLSSLATTIYFCGVMVGGVIFGHLADKCGRKPVMLASLFLPTIVGLGTAFAPWYSVFVALRFAQGVLMQGLQTSTYTLAMELFLPQHRSYAGAVLECFWGLAVMAVPLLAYLIPNWRHLQVVIALPSILALPYICLMPESLRWLIMRNRLDDAEQLVTKVTKVNKMAFPQRSWDDVKLQMSVAENDNKQYSVLDVLRTPNLRKRSLILFYLWFAISIGYYGLTWQLTSLPGNKYLNFFIAGSVEFVAYTLVIYITKRFGRKRPLMTYFFLASAFMVGSGTLPLLASGPSIPLISSGLAICGKFAMGGLFSVIFLYTSELYPTVVRNIGMGSCAFWTRVGGVIAPQMLALNLLVDGMKSLSLVLCGLVTLLGGFLAIMLPETLGRKLPDNLDDVEGTGSNSDLYVIAGAEEMKRLGEQTERL